MNEPPISIDSKSANQDDYEFDVIAEEVAKARGLRVVYPTDHQLQIDLDTEESFAEFRRRIDSMDFKNDYPTVIEDWSASGFPHRHITLTFKTRVFSEWERIALQAALGDDPIRVFLNAKRKEWGTEKPCRLFEK